MILATTSHDFWLKFLTPRIWKRIHYLIYTAYISVVAHVSFGILQDQQNHTFTIIFIVAASVVAILHVMAALHERKHGDPFPSQSDDWVKACETSEMKEGFAKIVQLTQKERVAVFLHEGKLSAISNACAHQNGPLGEEKIIRCLVTCPWHGFQYDVTNGSSPAPFTEKVPTYNLKIEGTLILVNRQANTPGTFVEPLVLNSMEAV